MRSAIIITPKSVGRNVGVREFNRCLASAEALSKSLASTVKISLQHNMRNDVFTVLVEAGSRTFGHYSPSFAGSFAKTRREIDRFIKEKKSEELRSAPKQATRKESSKRRWGIRTERKRIVSLRQG